MKQIILFIFISSSISLKAQFPVNPGIDTSSVEHKEVLKFWTYYLSSNLTKNTEEYLKFWNKKEKKEFPQPDLTLHRINTEQNLFRQGYLTILSILPYENDYYQIKTAVGWGDSTMHVYLLAITNHYVKKTNNSYKLYMPLSIKKNIKNYKNDKFNLYTLQKNNLDKKILDSLEIFIQKLKKDYEINQDKNLTIIYGKSSTETDEILGFDFNLMSSTNNPTSGISDLKNNLIIINGTDVLFHETTHIYLNPLFPNSPLLEGLATFYGGHMGVSLNKHIISLDNYLKLNPNIDVFEKLKTSFYIDNKMNPNYILQSVLIKLVYDKDGIEGIKRIMNYQSYSEIFEKEFNVKADYNKFLRKVIDNYNK